MSGITERIGVRIGGELHLPYEPFPVAVLEPATDRVIARLVGGGSAEARRALDVVSAALPHWSGTPSAVRAASLRDIAASLRDPPAAGGLATAISRETGKRIAESEAEVKMASAFFEWFAAAIETRHGEIWQSIPGVRHEVSSHALGVVAVVTPWNFPLSIPARKIAAALAAGCTVLFKPSEVAPSAALCLAEIVDRACPPGVLATMLGDAPLVTRAWLEDRRVRGLSFTGSTRVGRDVATRAAENFVRCTLELGGNAPFVVLDDADLDYAVQMLMTAKYRNNGQSCIAANHVWVPRSRHDDFVAAFIDASRKLVIGDPTSADTTLGPLALSGDPARVSALVDKTRGQDGEIIETHDRLPERGYFASPMICVDPPIDAPLVTQEVFGPAVSILRYDDLDTVLTVTRCLPQGLCGYVVGGDAARAADVARALEIGIAGVNTATPNTPQIPFGGLKDSGLGWDGGVAGLDQFMTYRGVAIGSLGMFP